MALLQLVVGPQDRLLDLPLRHLGRRAVLLGAVMPVADPVGLPVGDLHAAHGPAFSAVDSLAVDGCPGLCPAGELLLAGGHQGLHPLEFVTAHNGRMAVLREVLRLLPPVANLPEGDGVSGEGLLPDHVPGIGDVGQDVVHCRGIPFLPVVSPIRAQPVQLVGDVILALPVQVGVIDPANQLGLLGDDLQIPADQTVSIGGGWRDEQALFHPYPHAGSHIARVVGGLHLGEGPIDLGDLLRGHLSGVDVLFLEVDGDAQPEQFPHELDVLLGVAGEPGDGFHQNPVDLPRPAVLHHAVEIVPFPGLQPSDALVRVDVHQLPVLSRGDVLAVEVHLGDVGVDLVICVAADSGVCRYPQLGPFRDVRVDHGDPRNTYGACVYCGHIFFDLLPRHTIPWSPRNSHSPIPTKNGREIWVTRPSKIRGSIRQTGGWDGAAAPVPPAPFLSPRWSVFLRLRGPPAFSGQRERISCPIVLFWS